MIGETISHYRIVERLGAGGMGEVYKAEDTRLQRFVALKLMSHRGGDSDGEMGQMRARFLREAQAASALNHPNIVTIHEIDEFARGADRYHFIVMEFVPGKTLKELAGQCSVAEALALIAQIADALAEAHERGIVHRDVKPSNVIVTAGQRVKVLDFGIAKFATFGRSPLEDNDTASVFATEAVQTVPGAVLGTFAYMSPEQALGREVDHRSDIFSLGILAYELIAGRLPFAGNSSLAVVDAILHADPIPLSRFDAHVSPQLESIIHRMLEKSPELRYGSLRQARADLLASQGARATGAIVPASYETQVFAARSGGVGLTSTGSGISATRVVKQRAGQSVAVLRFNNITRKPEDDWLGVGIAETVTADLKSIEGLTVIGRELIYEVLRRWSAEHQSEFDEKFATRLGQEVGARWIVSGGYQRLGELLRITARAVEVETGEIFRTVKIDGRMEDVFDLQDKIVFELSRDLDLSLRSAERAVISEKETEVMEAYEAYAKAKMHVFSGNVEKLDQGIALLEQAIALDPHYAQAYAGLGYALALKGQFLNQVPVLERAIEYLQKAIELRPQLPDSYSALGLAFTALDRVDDAIGALRRALAFAPHDPFVHSALGRAYFIGKGDFAAAAVEFEHALQHESEATWIAPALAHCLVYLGEYDRAAELAHRAIRAQEQSARTHEGIQIVGSYSRLGHIYYLQGRYESALIEFNRELDFILHSDHALKDRARIEVQQKLTGAYARQGQMDDARALWAQLEVAFNARLSAGNDDPFTRYYVACAAAMVGETDAALKHLGAAIAGRRNFNVARARIEPDFDGLRGDARFQALLHSKP